jgi:pimeloyl-ACP methyl ester carboxylesterase
MATPANLETAWILGTGYPIHYWRSLAPERLSAPPVVFVHGFGVSGASLLPTATLLASAVPTLVPDLPGSGRSPRPPNVLSIPELRAVLRGFLDSLGIERAILVGHSMGAIVALETARVAPERVHRLVLVAPAEGTQVRSLLFQAARLACEVVREPLRLQALVIPEVIRFGPLNAGRLYWHLRHYSLADRLRSVETPTLVVLGPRDPLVNLARIVESTRGNERVQVACVQGAAHGMPYSHAPQLTGLIRTFGDGVSLSDERAMPSGFDL